LFKFTGHLLSDEILLAVREWEREAMGITNGNGKGMGMNRREWEGMGLKKTFPLISRLHSVTIAHAFVSDICDWYVSMYGGL